MLPVPVPCTPAGSSEGQNFLLISWILGSLGYIRSLGQGNQLSESSECLSCCWEWCAWREGGWLVVYFNSSLSQFWLWTLLESSCSNSRIRAEEVAVVKMLDFCLTSPCHLC